MIPDPRSERDTLIGVTAVVHNMTVVTRYVDNVHSTGARLLNAWDSV
ncbi:MAG: type II toxin-antitoxin system VapC family toxin [Betaproteobacteria bacterium]|nr:type II toxin-antitoxin system VapC family toxin [Betaproteobacteria bacterium]